MKLIARLIIRHVFGRGTKFSIRFDDLLNGAEEILFCSNLNEKKNNSLLIIKF